MAPLSHEQCCEHCLKHLRGDFYSSATASSSISTYSAASSTTAAAAAAADGDAEGGRRKTSRVVLPRAMDETPVILKPKLWVAKRSKDPRDNEDMIGGGRGGKKGFWFCLFFLIFVK